MKHDFSGADPGVWGGSVEPPKLKEKTFSFLTRAVSEEKNISERNKMPV